MWSMSDSDHEFLELILFSEAMRRLRTRCIGDGEYVSEDNLRLSAGEPRAD